MTNSHSNRKPIEHRRLLVLVMSVTLLVGYGIGLTVNDQSGFKPLSEMMGRIGLLLGALWLAWDSLRRPAQWLPPGMALASILVLAVLAAQPKLIVAALPALGVLIAVSVVVRALRPK
jgi:hypothetical protein